MLTVTTLLNIYIYIAYTYTHACAHTLTHKRYLMSWQQLFPIWYKRWVTKAEQYISRIFYRPHSSPNSFISFWRIPRGSPGQVRPPPLSSGPTTRVPSLRLSHKKTTKSRSPSPQSSQSQRSTITSPSRGISFHLPESPISYLFFSLPLTKPRNLRGRETECRSTGEGVHSPWTKPTVNLCLYFGLRRSNKQDPTQRE